MTLKGIVEKLVSDQAVEYFDGLCREHGVKVYGRTVSSVELEKGKNEYTFTVTINIFDDHSGWYAETPSTYVEIGGTVDDTFGCLVSCIHRGTKYLWLATESGREAFGITEFII